MRPGGTLPSAACSRPRGDRLHQRRGFLFWGTYAELCVVVAIVALLAAILFPVFAKAREKARQTSCQNNLSQVYLALSIYAYDHGGRYPPADNDLSPLHPRYLRTRDVLVCPTASREDPSSALSSYQYRGGLATDALPYLGLMSDTEFRHNDGANVLAADGHVKWFSGSKAIPTGGVPPFTSEWDQLGLPVPRFVGPPPSLAPPPPAPGPPPSPPVPPGTKSPASGSSGGGGPMP